MKKQWIWIGLSIALIALIAVAGALYQKLTQGIEPDAFAVHPTSVPSQEDPVATEAPKVQAPDFSMEDGKGNRISLSDFRGKPVILNFWASWCGPCKSEMPAFEEAWENHGEEIHFMMVNLTDGGQETREAADTFLQKNGYGFPVYYDVFMEGAAAYRVLSIPATYLIDADGYVVAQGRGALEAEALALGIRMLIGEN